jgi:protein-disulfide isomerase
MKRVVIAVLLCGSVFAQKDPVPIQERSNSIAHPQSAATPSQRPDLQTVEMFMHRMFGQDPNIKWRVASVGPSLIPGVAQVRILIGDPPQPANLFVMPDQKFAIVGDALPFGSDPFAPVRQRLRSEAFGQSRGPADAAITIVEFADLQCPGCRAAHPLLERLIKDFPQSRFVFQHFPLANHNWAAQAAAYAECIDQQKPGAFWKFLASVYEAQPEITETTAVAKFEELATQAGTDIARLTTCARSPGVTAKIQRSVDLGRSVGVSGTPAVYVNGRRIASVTDVPYESLKQVIEFEAAMTAR